MNQPGDYDLPTNGRDQSCALCGTPHVSWLHPLDKTLLQYREYGKGHTLPTFWTTCDRCEELLRSGQDEQLIALMKQSGGFRPEITEWSSEDETEVLRKPLVTFRRADLGPRPLPAEK